MWPTPCARMAWNFGPKVAFEYPAGRVGSDTFEIGVLGYPKTVVHCLISSKKFCGYRVVSLDPGQYNACKKICRRTYAVPCQTCIFGRAPV